MKLNIYDLSDDVMIMIFRLLKIEDRIRLERACSGWKKLLTQSWTRFQCLDLSITKWRSRPKYSIIKDLITWGPRNAQMIKSAVIRSGSYLKIIDFAHNEIANTVLSRYKFNCANTCILSIISKHCTHLSSITINVCCTDGLENFAKNCETLESISLFGLQHFDSQKIDKLLEKLIRKNFKINSICLNEIKSLKFLLNVENKLKIVNFNVIKESSYDIEYVLVNCIEKSKISLKKFYLKIFELDFVKISKVLRLCTNLNELKLDVDLFINNDNGTSLKNVFERCRNIKVLTVNGLKLDSNNNMSKISTVHWLHYLNADSLEELNISTGESNQMYMIRDFPIFLNLRHLSLYGVTFDNEIKFCDSLEMFLNLEKFQLSECNLSMKTSSGKYFFNNCTKLKYFSFYKNRHNILDDDHFVNSVSVKLHNLENLYLGLPNLSDAGLKNLSKLKKLYSMSIFFNSKLSGSSLFELKTLEKLQCVCCKELKEISLRLLIRAASNLRKLIILYCPHITRDIINFSIKEKSSNELNQTTLNITACIYNTKATDFNKIYPGLKLDLIDHDVDVPELEN